MKMRKNMNTKEEVIKHYREYLIEEERSQATIDKYLHDVERFLKELPEERHQKESWSNESQTNESKSNKSKPNEKQLKESYSNESHSKEIFLEKGILEKEIVLEYKQKLKDQYKISSANSMLAALNSFFVFLGREELKVKLFKIQKVLYSRPEREISGKDYEKLVRTAKRTGDIQMSMLLQTLGSTGIRISELKFVTVEALKSGRAEIYNKGKSRIVLLPVELTRLLEKYARKQRIKTGSIFITSHGNPVDRSNVSKKMKQLAKEAGVDPAKVFPHNFRHLFARMFYSIEKDVVRLMDLLGHSNISTTRIYTATTEDQPRRQMSRMRMVLG